MKTKTVLVFAIVLAATPAFARPEFLARYMNDPFAKAATCALCHVSPAGGGPRNEFGKAVAREGFQITPALRAQFPDRFQAGKTSKTAESQGRQVKVVWAAAKENEAVVQIGDESFLMNRAEGTLVKITGEQAAAFAAPAAPVAPVAAARPAPGSILDEDARTVATFDNYLVNLPTNHVRPPHSLEMHFTHRFSKPLTGQRGLVRDLFGLDSNSLSSFGIEAGITRWLSFVTYRSPLDRTIEIGPHVRLLEQSKRVPVTLSLRATVEGEENFGQRHTTNFQPIISRTFSDRAELFVVPTFSIAVPRRTLTFDFPFTTGEKRDNQAAIGTGISIRIRPRVALVAEWTPRVGGFRRSGTSNSYAFAIQRRTNRHVFGLVFSTNQASTTARSISDGRQDLRIGFNIYRRIF